MDVHILGTGTETPEAIHAGGTSPQNGPLVTKRTISNRRSVKNRALRMLTDVEFRKHNQERRKKHRELNREKLNLGFRQRYAANREQRKQAYRLKVANNPVKFKADKADYYLKNKARIKVRHDAWKSENQEHIKAYRLKTYPRVKELAMIRYHKCPSLKIKSRCRTYLRNQLLRFGVEKTERTFDLIGCTPEFLRDYLAAKFTEGMSWDNYGKWHVDHIIPIKKFDLTDNQQMRHAFNYSNCQPLWKKDNLIKSASLPPTHQALLL